MADLLIRSEYGFVGRRVGNGVKHPFSKFPQRRMHPGHSEVSTNVSPVTVTMVTGKYVGVLTRNQGCIVTGAFSKLVVFPKEFFFTSSEGHV